MYQVEIDHNSIKKIGELYRVMRDDDNVDKLQIKLDEPNIFSVLRVQRQEIRHSNFLAWILSPHGNHGLGGAFLERILRHVSTLSDHGVNESIELERESGRVIEIRREWKNIDLLILTENAVLCFENKVDSKESEGQLKKYRDIVIDHFSGKKKYLLFIYLTPSGDLPKEINETMPFVPLSYQTIVEHLSRVVELHQSRVSQKTIGYCADYITILQRDIMNNDEVNKLADDIYRNHKDLFDFVFANRTDIAETLYEIIEQRVIASGWTPMSKNKGFVRFLTPELAKIMPKHGIGWPGRESFLFEINFYWQTGKIVFKTVIAPTDNTEVQRILSEAIKNVPGSKTPQGKKQLVHFTKSWPFDINQVYSPDDVAPLLEKMWPDIQSIVAEVSSELLSITEQLVKHR